MVTIFLSRSRQDGDGSVTGSRVVNHVCVFKCACMHERIHVQFQFYTYIPSKVFRMLANKALITLLYNLEPIILRALVIDSLKILTCLRVMYGDLKELKRDHASTKTRLKPLEDKVGRPDFCLTI